MMPHSLPDLQGLPLATTLAQLIRRTASDLPRDIETSMRQALAHETPDSRAAMLLASLCQNITLARNNGTPMCQDTGTLTFFWQVPRTCDQQHLRLATADAVIAATQAGWLRHNTIETLSGRSLSDNLAPGHPVHHFECWPDERQTDLEVWLLLKGGGCENMSCQYSLPDTDLKAGRDLAGVRRVLLDAVWRAQGYGCAPGILGVCLGGDRATGYTVAKQQLLRPLPDHAAAPELAALEQNVCETANSLGIGPMGMGGKTTLLGVKIAQQARLPASYFVSVAYMCWAARRHGIRLRGDGSGEWLSS